MLVLDFGIFNLTIGSQIWLGFVLSHCLDSIKNVTHQSVIGGAHQKKIVYQTIVNTLKIQGKEATRRWVHRTNDAGFHFVIFESLYRISHP